MGMIGKMLALLRPLDARDEGLAAGTGLLTGRVAEQVVTQVTDCPQCGRPAVVDVLDLIDREARYVCTACAHRWTVLDLSGRGGR